ncbi:MAG: TVP38/TMEM64 family protein [Desulfovibrio sp.]|uniref:TVP38/TMEM64 family protein n=1 Tax=Desulfovibrio sp. 7SRBS1 TaxID=3378064 RepID=UPI003B427298
MTQNKKTPVKALLKGLVLIGTLVCIGWFIRASGLEHMFDTAWVDREIRGRGALGWLLFIAGTGLLTGIGLPRQIPAFLAGYAFGAVAGTVVAVLGCGLGCVLSFSYARFLGREFVQAKFGKRIAKVDAFLSTSPFSMSLLLRLMPVGNNLLTCLIGGVTSIPLLPFVAGSIVGYTPQTLIFALLGSGIRVNSTVRYGLAAVLFVGATLWGYRIYRKYRKSGVEAVDGEE